MIILLNIKPFLLSFSFDTYAVRICSCIHSYKIIISNVCCAALNDCRFPSPLFFPHGKRFVFVHLFRSLNPNCSRKIFTSFLWLSAHHYPLSNYIDSSKCFTNYIYRATVRIMTNDNICLIGNQSPRTLSEKTKTKKILIIIQSSHMFWFCHALQIAVVRAERFIKAVENEIIFPFWFFFYFFRKHHTHETRKHTQTKCRSHFFVFLTMQETKKKQNSFLKLKKRKTYIAPSLFPFQKYTAFLTWL